MIRIAIVDDNDLLRINLVDRLYDSFDIVFETNYAGDLLEYLKKVPEFRMPQVVLMDIEMDMMNGIEATAKLKSALPAVKVIMLTVFEDDERVLQSIMAGADGYMLKDERRERIIEAIHDTVDGGAYMSPGIAQKAIRLLKKAVPENEMQVISYDLTRRELEILNFLSEGLTYKQIAERIFVSVSTIKTHVHNIYEKLQVTNKVEASNKLSRMAKLRG
jgi:DNA-binding NarL/FixJ family response regulator